jgi:hypothetical protein
MTATDRNPLHTHCSSPYKHMFITVNYIRRVSRVHVRFRAIQPQRLTFRNWQHHFATLHLKETELSNYMLITWEILALNYDHIYVGVVLHIFHCNETQQNVHKDMPHQFPRKCYHSLPIIPWDQCNVKAICKVQPYHNDRKRQSLYIEAETPGAGVQVLRTLFPDITKLLEKIRH